MRDEIPYLTSADERSSSDAPAPTPYQPRDQLQTVLTRLSSVLERALGVPSASTAGELETATRPDVAGWQPPALSDVVLQELRFSAPRSGTEVMYRVVEGRAQALESGILVGEGARVSFDTYLNSFYEHYWARHAPLDRLTIRLFGSGTVIVEVFRAMPDGSSYRIGRRRIELDSRRGATASVELEPSPAGSGRIFLELAAPDGALVLMGRLEAESGPLRPIRLGIGLCTFNREKMLLANLRRLVASSYYRWASPKIVIVNQGKRFALSEMNELLRAESGHIEVIEQGNFGGAGGFTRAAMEIVRGGECSHVLFMDDDIEFDPDVLITTQAFAGRTTQPTVIGGGMLDLFRPSTMYEAGAVVAGNNIIRAVLHNRRLDDTATIDSLAREIPCHFNGWWYCAIPAEAFRQHGLPLPIFIRGDDMEYGVRLMSRGIPTVSLPPVCVWHEPFYAKAPSWLLYYDLRNRLIFAANHQDLVHLDSASVILRRLLDSLAKHDYMQAELIIRAVEDFLAGPSVLDTPMDVLHQDIAALAAQHAPHRPTSTVGMAPAPWREPPRGVLRPLTLLRGLADLYFGRVEGRMRPDLVFSDQWHPWMTMHVSQYALADRMLSYVQVYRYDREKMQSCMRRGLAAVRRYKKEAMGAAGQWQSAYDELTSWPRWDRLLGLAPEMPAKTPETPPQTVEVVSPRIEPVGVTA